MRKSITDDRADAPGYSPLPAMAISFRHIHTASSQRSSHHAAVRYCLSHNECPVSLPAFPHDRSFPWNYNTLPDDNRKHAPCQAPSSIMRRLHCCLIHRIIRWSKAAFHPAILHQNSGYRCTAPQTDPAASFLSLRSFHLTPRCTSPLSHHLLPASTAYFDRRRCRPDRYTHACRNSAYRSDSHKACCLSAPISFHQSNRHHSQYWSPSPPTYSRDETAKKTNDPGIRSDHEWHFLQSSVHHRHNRRAHCAWPAYAFPCQRQKTHS